MTVSPGAIVQDAFRGKTIVPKGTADATMARLFPEQRSKVPYDAERKAAVYYILEAVGAFTLGNSNDIQGTDDAAEGDSGE